MKLHDNPSPFPMVINTQQYLEEFICRQYYPMHFEIYCSSLDDQHSILLHCTYVDEPRELICRYEVDSLSADECEVVRTDLVRMASHHQLCDYSYKFKDATLTLHRKSDVLDNSQSLSARLAGLRTIPEIMSVKVEVSSLVLCFVVPGSEVYRSLCALLFSPDTALGINHPCKIDVEYVQNYPSN